MQLTKYHKLELDFTLLIYPLHPLAVSLMLNPQFKYSHFKARHCLLGLIPYTLLILSQSVTMTGVTKQQEFQTNYLYQAVPMMLYAPLSIWTVRNQDALASKRHKIGYRLFTMGVVSSLLAQVYLLSPQLLLIYNEIKDYRITVPCFLLGCFMAHPWFLLSFRVMSTGKWFH